MTDTCRNGHLRTEANTYVWRDTRACQICRAANVAKHRSLDPEPVRFRIRRWYAERGGREHMRDYLREKTYGITPADFKRLLLVQGGVCAICGEDEERTIRSTGERRPLTVDHDHDTGAVRGLLCARCNAALGLFRDDPEIIAQAIAYIGRNKAEEAK